MNTNSYNPDFVSPPGDTLAETLEALGVSQTDLARRMGRPVKTVNEIAQGKAAITPDTALQLERALGIPAEFWSARESAYQTALAKHREADRLRAETKWLKSLPVKAMVKLGWVQSDKVPVAMMRQMLVFFGIASPEQFEAVCLKPVKYRRSQAFASDPAALAAWLRKGELDAQTLRFADYHESAFRDALRSIRSATGNDIKEAIQDAIQRCADSGVALVIVPELPGTRVSGATRWLTPSRALIQLSLRYKRDDQLWFSFFHEAGHILLHGKRDLFLEEGASTDIREVEANQFAQDFLIPRAAYKALTETGSFSREAIAAFARHEGIAPGIVVGRLQHDRILSQSHLNDLKRAVSEDLARYPSSSPIRT
jgi:addiction module HigA family antidote